MPNSNRLLLLIIAVASTSTGAMTTSNSSSCDKGEKIGTGGDCEACHIGKYGVLESCVRCDIGKYQNERKQTQCKVCKDMKIPNIEQTKCVRRPAAVVSPGNPGSVTITTYTTTDCSYVYTLK